MVLFLFPYYCINLFAELLVAWTESRGVVDGAVRIDDEEAWDACDAPVLAELGIFVLVLDYELWPLWVVLRNTAPSSNFPSNKVFPSPKFPASWVSLSVVSRNRRATCSSSSRNPSPKTPSLSSSFCWHNHFSTFPIFYSPPSPHQPWFSYL